MRPNKAKAEFARYEPRYRIRGLRYNDHLAIRRRTKVRARRLAWVRRERA